MATSKVVSPIMTAALAGTRASASAASTMDGAGFEGCSSAVCTVAKTPCQPAALDHAVDALARFSGRDPEDDIAGGGERGDRVRGAGVEMFGVSGFLPDREPSLLVAPRQPCDGSCRPDQGGEGLVERETDHRQRTLPRRVGKPLGGEGAPLRLDDVVLAVDQRAIDVEDHQAHGAPVPGRAGALVHLTKKCVQIRSRRLRPDHRDMDVVHAESGHDLQFLWHRMLLGRHQVDDRLVPRCLDVEELLLCRLTGGSDRVTDSFEGADVP